MNVKNLTAAEMKVIDACKRELAMNFDCPAPQILRVYGAKIGLSGREMDSLLRSLVRE